MPIARRAAVVLFALLSASSAGAQTRFAPYIAFMAGGGILQTRERAVLWSPWPRTVHSTNVIPALAGSLTAGVELGRHVSMDVVLHGSDGTEEATGKDFAAVTVGPSVSVGVTRQLYLRVGIGRVRGSEFVLCANGAACNRVGEWRDGMDLSAGVDVQHTDDWSFGPTIWWTQGTSGDRRYASLGVGLRARSH